ncbi:MULTISPECIES: haloacid dehalogenase type II [unclassified Beijerinckia]|uniref:haloacid dehalogenase type II n=1 Tax=unclassified Beijerinckia TaxID=2638183 RepID=UPI000895D76E|nr:MULTISPECIES: haloacid dehalogenase type II [unclassified Beijerinckia]MDH7796483.1 2-haloacid dehalogenase [Beijerinckia sp. GAS462]SEC47058.1 2-haloacid dehalogenase [Beijerinckia sp. 28-YEA-48]
MAAAIYAFDAYGTLFNVHAAVDRHRDAIGAQADRLSELWRAKQLEYTWTRTLMGAYRDFRVLTAQALDFAAARFGGIDAQTRAALLAAYETLDAYPDAKPCLAALKAQGARLAILSNGTPAMLEAAIDAAGLNSLFDAVLSVDTLQAFKTLPRTYELVTARFQAKPDAVTFLSSNRWDIAGARQFGFRPVWVNRTSQPDEYPDLSPVKAIKSLAELPGLETGASPLT